MSQNKDTVKWEKGRGERVAARWLLSHTVVGNSLCDVAATKAAVKKCDHCRARGGSGSAKTHQFKVTVKPGLWLLSFLALFPITTHVVLREMQKFVSIWDLLFFYMMRPYLHDCGSMSSHYALKKRRVH